LPSRGTTLLSMLSLVKARTLFTTRSGATFGGRHAGHLQRLAGRVRPGHPSLKRPFRLLLPISAGNTSSIDPNCARSQPAPATGSVRFRSIWHGLPSCRGLFATAFLWGLQRVPKALQRRKKSFRRCLWPDKPPKRPGNDAAHPRQRRRTSQDCQAKQDAPRQSAPGMGRWRVKQESHIPRAFAETGARKSCR